jgi:hypothetical protein
MTAVFPSRKFITNAGSKNMAVNGSVTPVVFGYSPPAGSLFTVDELILNATGTGTISQPLTEFWDFTALPNGISIEFMINGVMVSESGIIKNNFDLIQYVGAEFLGKIIGTRNIVRGGFHFTPQFTLNGSLGDYFRVIVNDNLTVGGKIEQLTISMRGVIIAL